ncbi:MAG: hypothetical protein QW548_00190 [Candidatus Aenigmatarchaeota archaeon]
MEIKYEDSEEKACVMLGDAERAGMLKGIPAFGKGLKYDYELYLSIGDPGQTGVAVDVDYKKKSIRAFLPAEDVVGRKEIAFRTPISELVVKYAA